MSGVLDVVAAIIFDRDQILACRRRPEKAAGGKWEFPGGKIEAGETPARALRREISEELAADIRVLDEFTTDDTRVGDLTIRLICLRATLTGPRPSSSSDHDRLRWVYPDELAALDWAEPDFPAVRLLAALGTRG